MEHKTQIFAHRGASGERPENTLCAFQRALELQVDGVELDVQASADGKLVVVHDEMLGRTNNGNGYVFEKTLPELKQLDAGSWFGSQFAGEGIPTLAETLDLLKGHPLRINLELKTLYVPYPGLVEAVLKLVKENGLDEQVVLSSFNHHSLLQVRQLAPHLETAALFWENVIAPWDYVKNHGFTSMHALFRNVDQAFYEACAEREIPLRAWTVNEEPDASRLASLGVNALITDHPAKMKALIQD